MKLMSRENLETPMYGLAESALYLRVPIKTLEYWVQGRGKTPGLIEIASSKPRTLSFTNLLECHMLTAMRGVYGLHLPKIRTALSHLRDKYGYKHPLIEKTLFTDHVDLLSKEMGGVVNLSRDGQLVIPEIVELHLERIEQDPKGLFKFYPFVRQRRAGEPKLILMNPEIGFGKPVLAGTGVSTAVIASRFNARESVNDLAEEYGVSKEQIEEAIRWETRAVAA